MIATPAPPTDEIVRRKVTASGVIWLRGHAYYISRRLAGQTIGARISDDRLIVDTTVPLRKEYILAQAQHGPLRRARGWRTIG
jgi:hypothetical protein